MTFQVDLPVPFGDCDFAGIAYYPRLLALLDAAIEGWTAVVIGFEHATMHQRYRLGLRTVTLSTHFERPSRLGEIPKFTVGLAALGDSSITLDVKAEVTGEPRLNARLVQGLIDIDGVSKTPLPEAWRSRIAASLQSVAAEWRQPISSVVATDDRLFRMK